MDDQDFISHFCFFLRGQNRISCDNNRAKKNKRLKQSVNPRITFLRIYLISSNKKIKFYFCHLYKKTQIAQSVALIKIIPLIPLLTISLHVGDSISIKFSPQQVFVFETAILFRDLSSATARGRLCRESEILPEKALLTEKASTKASQLETRFCCWSKRDESFSN